MFDGTEYVVRFPNGKYFSGGYTMGDTDDLKQANKYTFDWQISRDLYLQLYCETNNLTYELVKVRMFYEVVD